MGFDDERMNHVYTTVNRLFFSRANEQTRVDDPGGRRENSRWGGVQVERLFDP